MFFGHNKASQQIEAYHGDKLENVHNPLNDGIPNLPSSRKLSIDPLGVFYGLLSPPSRGGKADQMMIAPDLQTRLTKWTLNWLLLSERLPNISCCSVVAYLDLLLVFLICMSRGFSWAKNDLLRWPCQEMDCFFWQHSSGEEATIISWKEKRVGKKLRQRDQRASFSTFELWQLILVWRHLLALFHRHAWPSFLEFLVCFSVSNWPHQSGITI